MEAIRACMFVTHDAGMMRARPMAAIPDRAENSVWFFTARTSAKPEELRDDQRCCLVFHQSDGGVFLSVSGRTRLSRDSDLMRHRVRHNEQHLDGYWQRQRHRVWLRVRFGVGQRICFY